MDIIRIGVLTMPEENRSRWARSQLSRAISEGIEPVAVPSHQVQSFAAPIPVPLAQKLRAMATAREISMPTLTAGLIEALSRSSEPTESEAVDESDILGMDSVREILHPLLKQTHAGLQGGKVVFSEAATGTGKGRMIAALALDSAARGEQVVISAPLSVTWQLVSDLAQLPRTEQVSINLLLGRPNFVDPEAVRGWAVENERQELIDWVDNGGGALSERTQSVARLTGQPLFWLLEDALSKADDLPVSAVMLSGDSEGDCPAEGVYQAIKNRNKDTQNGILLCSHHMLASHIRQSAFHQDKDYSPSGIPQRIDTLLVDEAHLLEAAFASIFSNTIHLRTLTQTIQDSVRIKKKPALAALGYLGQEINARFAPGRARTADTGQIADFSDLVPHIKAAEDALGAIKTKNLDAHATRAIQAALAGFRSALSGRSTLRFEVSPVRRYPAMTAGRSNLEGAMGSLWDAVGSAGLFSATLFAGDSANLTRWKLGVKKERAVYCQPVHPAWTRDTVTLHPDRADVLPDDTVEWADSVAGHIRSIAAKATGGTLVLCTSYENVQQLTQQLVPELSSRIITQSTAVSASSCALQFAALYHAGLRPVWLGVGAAWTGINLSDTQAVAGDDHMLSDLVVTRLPMGLNRTLTHERRTRIGGFGVVVQESLWHFRQGIGRLVRREGVPEKHLWVLDARLDSDAPWVGRFHQLLAGYKRRL